MPCPVAASAAVAAVLTGPRRRVEVAAVTRDAVYLATGEPGVPALCLASPAAIRVPCALVLRHPPPAPLAVGTAGWAGDGLVSLGPFTARVARWWRPPRPHGLATGLAAALQQALATAPPPDPDPATLRRTPATATPPDLDPTALRRTPATVPNPDPAILRPAPAAGAPLDSGTEAAAAALQRALAAGAPLGDVVAALLGRGPGLTPVGDDILAGALVTLCALGPASEGAAPPHPAAVAARDRLREAVGRLAASRTGFVSGALLHHAARGECIPELAGVLGGRLPVADLWRVGHSSGAGLARGVLAALPHAGTDPAAARAPGAPAVLSSAVRP